MKYRETIDYPLPSAAVFRCFGTPDFFVRKYTEQGATNVRVDAAEFTSGHFTITITRDVPVEVELPAIARGRVPDRITIVQTDSWDLAQRRGKLDIRFRGLPVQATCTMTMQDTPAGARQTLDFDLHVNLPLIGGKLEEVLARDLRLKFRRDTAVTLQLLAGTTTTNTGH